MAPVALNEAADPAVVSRPPVSPPAKMGGDPSLGPSPDTSVKRLICALDALQQQQAHAEAQRHAAEQAAAGRAAEAAALQAQLHVALRLAADLDDKEQEVQAALDALLMQQAQRSEHIRLAARRLSGLRAECSGADAQQLEQKQALAADLQARLLAAGMDEATLAQLCSDAAQSCIAGAQPAGGEAAKQLDARRTTTWLAGFRRRASAAT